MNDTGAHECTIYCRDGLHATLAYEPLVASIDVLIEIINDQEMEMVGFGLVRVVDYFPAREAPIPPHLAGKSVQAWVLLVQPVEQEAPT